MEKNFVGTPRTKFATLVAVFCILLALFTLFSFSGNDPFWMSEEFDSVKATVNEMKDALNSAIDEQEEAQKSYDAIYEANKSKIDALEAQLQTANDNLDKVCSEDTYDASRRGYFYITYGPCYGNGCQALHAAVDTAEEAVEELDKKLGLSELKDKLEDLEEKIPEMEADLDEKMIRYNELSSAMTKAVFMLIATLLCVAAMVGFGVGLLKDPFGKITAFSVYGLMAGTLILIFCGFVSMIISMIALIMFACIISQKNSKAVKMRVTAIVCAVIFGLASVVSFALIELGIVALVLYIITIILASFVLVPLEFKYTSIAKHIFLSIITLGIWLLVWIYHITKNLNNVSDMEYRNPTHELLLCMFLPLYGIYWLYKTAENVEDFGLRNDKKYNISILCLIFALALPMISTILIQDKINQTLGKEEETCEEPAPEAEIAEEAIAEELVAVDAE